MVESDEEQVEVLKQWWDENGTFLVVTVVLSLGAVFGYRAWQTNVQETGESASAIYQNLVVATDPANAAVSEAVMATANSLADDLKTNYSDSAYAVFAALHLAKIAVENDDLAKARTQLEWAKDNVDNQEMETIVRMRLARVLLELDEVSLALSQLETHQPEGTQVASWEETKGDVYVAMGDQAAARSAYQRALENLSGEVSKPLLEVKLADIPVGQSAPTVEPLVEPLVEEDSAEDDAEGDDA